MKNLYLYLAALLAVSQFIYSQNFYLPRNIQNAYFNNTRSYDGKPGPNYWQNKSKYDIQVKINPEKKTIHGQETVFYTNNSPDTLSKIVIRLYQDIFKIGQMRDFMIDKNDIHEGVKLFKIFVDKSSYELENSKKIFKRGTNMIINLDSSLSPGSTITLGFEWEFKLPEVSTIRMGVYDSTSFMIAYWYPQVAVYDDIDHWDMNSYTGQQEFYNDFNDYKVEIIAPSEFTVWATGELQNPEEIFSPDIYQKFKLAENSDVVIKIISNSDILEKKIVDINTKDLSWRFQADNVTDFAFALSDHYLWDAVSLVVDESTKRRTVINAAYNPSSKDFYDVADIAKKTIEYLSKELPGIPYPYPVMTIFNGGGGMEFPMMVNDGSTKSFCDALGLTSHEISHSYFPFFMGINETKYAWMDEGWAVMLPFDFQTKMCPEMKPVERNLFTFQNMAGNEMEFPPIIPSNQLRNESYRLAAYSRPGLAYYFLRDAIGKEKFEGALKEYIYRWQGKHPIPYDFFNTFNNYINEDLNWFWSPWFFEFGYPDLSIRDVKILKNKIFITIEKIGKIPIPIALQLTTETDEIINIYENTSIWKNGETEKVIDYKFDKKINHIKLGNNSIPDVDQKNNTYLIKNDY